MKEYFEHEDFNNVENTLYDFTEYFKTLNPELPLYDKKEWNLNDFPYIQNVHKIENGIKRITDYIYIPKGFNYKKWLDTDTSISLKNYSWSDYQRWLNNLELIQKMKEENPTLWNGISFFYWNQENKNDDWEE